MAELPQRPRAAIWISLCLLQTAVNSSWSAVSLKSSRGVTPCRFLEGGSNCCENIFIFGFLAFWDKILLPFYKKPPPHTSWYATLYTIHSKFILITRNIYADASCWYFSTCSAALVGLPGKEELLRHVMQSLSKSQRGSSPAPASWNSTAQGP